MNFRKAFESFGPVLRSSHSRVFSPRPLAVMRRVVNIMWQWWFRSSPSFPGSWMLKSTAAADVLTRNPAMIRAVFSLPAALNSDGIGEQHVPRCLGVRPCPSPSPACPCSAP